MRLAFTHVATENICDSEHPAHTLNSYFGINCKTGKCSEKKLKNMHNIQTIIISEIFMTPSYIMGHLSKIKNQFPHIKFICEGDPEQTRPVGEEDTNWLETKLLFNLCDGNMVKLTMNKRNNETDNYDKILEGKELCASKFLNREPQQVNEYPTSKYAFRQPCLWYISAVRNSGKSFLASKFLAQAKKDSTFDRIYIITPSFKSNEAYFGKYINEEDVYEPTKESISQVISEVEKDRDEWENYLKEVEAYKEFKELLKSKKGLKNMDDDLIMMYDELGFLEGKPEWKLVAGDCMPARVAPVSLWTDTGAVRCVTKAL